MSFTLRDEVQALCDSHGIDVEEIAALCVDMFGVQREEFPDAPWKLRAMFLVDVYSDKSIYVHDGEHDFCTQQDYDTLQTVDGQREALYNTLDFLAGKIEEAHAQ